MPTRRTFLGLSLALLALLLGLSILVLMVDSKPSAQGRAPYFEPGNPTDAVTNLVGANYYDWGGDVPFQLGRIWVWSMNNRTNLHTYWINLDKGTVLGELFSRGEAEFSDADGTKLLWSGEDTVFATWKSQFLVWIEKVTGGRVAPQLNREETFWILDLRNNRAKRIGGFSQLAGSGSRWRPAPGFRFGYNVPTTSTGRREFFLCDLDEEQMTRVRYQADIQGWWDDHQLLMKDVQNNFLLYDVLTQATNLLFSAAHAQDMLEDSGLPVNLDLLKATPIWTGTGYAFHFSARTNLINGPAYILRASASDGVPDLELFQQEFRFEWLGRFNSNCTFYVFPGESASPGSAGDGSVHIRDLKTGKTRTLVASDDSKQYTLPRFYKDRIIYMKARQLWSIDINGSNNFKLFKLPTNVDENGE